MKIIQQLLILFTLGVCLPAWAHSHLSCSQTPIRVALFDFAPFYGPDAKGHPEGFLVDQWQQVMTQLGCQWQAEFYTVPQLLENIILGKSDLTLLIRHPQLNGRTDYSHNAISQIELNIYFRPDVEPVTRIEQLANKRVIVIRGYGYGGLFTKLIDPAMATQIHIASDHQAGLEMLRSGRGDYLLGYQQATARALLKVSVNDLQNRHLQTWHLHVVASQHYRDKTLLAQIDQILENNKSTSSSTAKANVLSRSNRGNRTQ